MHNSQMGMIETLESIPLEDARRLIASGTYGKPGSENDQIAKAWLARKDTELAESRHRESISIARWTLVAAIAATVVAAIGAAIAWYR